MSAQKRLQKTTQLQYEYLLDYVTKNKVLHTGKTKPSEINLINSLWQQFATEINSLSLGPSKTAEQWKKIFIEWKTNTKRKSRDVKKELLTTGGGPKEVKKLTDLEQRLLSLISKIHLGDENLPDTLGEKDMDDKENPHKKIKIFNESVGKSADKKNNSEPELENLYNVSEVECSLNNILSLKFMNEENAAKQEFRDYAYMHSEQAPTNATDINFEQTPAPKGVNTKTKKNLQQPRAHDSRYSAQFLSSATESYKEAQELRNTSLFEIAGGIKQVSTALNNFNDIFNKYVEVENIKGEAKMIQANATLMEAQTNQILARLQLIKYLTE